ncbi:hypothetical protein D3C80_456900 [compost metagenome]
MLAEFVGDATNDMVDACLGPHIGGMVVEHDAGGHRRNLNDGAAPGHMAQQRLEVLERPGELDCVHPVQVFLAVLEEGLQEAPASGIDTDIEPAEQLFTLGNELRDLGL